MALTSLSPSLGPEVGPATILGGAMPSDLSAILHKPELPQPAWSPSAWNLGSGPGLRIEG